MRESQGVLGGWPKAGESLAGARIAGSAWRKREFCEFSQESCRNYMLLS